MTTSPIHLRRPIQDADMLSRHYRSIGPAAILAALLCMPRKSKTKRAVPVQEAA